MSSGEIVAQPVNLEQRSSKDPSATTVSCAFCSGKGMDPIIDFGDVALAGGFLKSEHFEDEQKFPLRLFFCRDCFAVQVVDVVDANVLFKNYFYFSSAIRSLREHFVDYATEVVSRFLDAPNSTVVEIGCNDGILLNPLSLQNVRTLVGVDPATNIVNTIDNPAIHIVNDFFSEPVAQKVIERHGKADMIVANNVYAHIPDIQGVTRGIQQLLADDGVFIFEVHYLGKVIMGLQYDMVYHEHLYYYSLIALINHFKRYGLTIFDVKPIPIHGGSMRYYVCKKTSKHAADPSPRVELLRQEELARGFDRPETFSQFAADVNSRKNKLMNLLNALRGKGRTIAGYGASGRANTIIQYCGITHDHIDYMIDDAPAKEGFYTPGSHFQIRLNNTLKTNPPDYLLLFAWTYFNEIAEKCRDYIDAGGRLIVPLPDVRVTFSPSNEDEL